MLKNELNNRIKNILGIKNISIEISKLINFGDYTTNIALKVKSNNSKIYAGELKRKLDNDRGLKEIVEKIEVAGPGFINIWINKKILLSNLSEVINNKDFGRTDLFKGRNILIEHTSPNPQTTIMLGHLRNNFLGMSVANIFEFLGAKVIRDCIINDRGIHISRSLWGYLAFAYKNSDFSKDEILRYKDITDENLVNYVENKDWKILIKNWSEKSDDWYIPSELNLKSDHANLIWYVLGSKAFKLSSNVNKQVKEILQLWEKEDVDVWKLWKQILEWSEKGYEETYKRVGSIHDFVWKESELYKGGKELVDIGLKKGIFKRSKGAIVTNLKSYKLADTVAIKSDGTSTYLVFDLNLTKQKTIKFPSDLYIWTIGEEQTLYFKQLFAICEQLGLGKIENFYHLSYALINFKGGKKMATREGSVIMADEILDELEEKATNLVNTTNKDLRGKISNQDVHSLSKKVALGALKYALLKTNRETTLFYDINESISLNGNNGPYIQYTAARAKSVLDNIVINNQLEKNEDIFIEKEELDLLRIFIHFPEVIEDAAINYSPNIISSYLYDLAQKYNSFYDKYRIINGDKETFRLNITKATFNIISVGLNLLGIQIPKRM